MLPMTMIEPHLFAPRSRKKRLSNESGNPPATAASQELTDEQKQTLLENLPTVRLIARRIHKRLPQFIEFEDLVSAGVVGLMDALTKFDMTKNVGFRNYASFRIRGAILDSLRSLDWSPCKLRRKGRAIEEAVQALTAKLGRIPDDAEVAAELTVGISEYQQLRGELNGLHIDSLNKPRFEDSDEEEVAYLPGRPEDDPFFCCMRGELVSHLTDAVSLLSDQERRVVTLYYYEEMTMREIGLVLGVGQVRVGQVHRSAVIHLRATLRDRDRAGDPSHALITKESGHAKPIGAGGNCRSNLRRGRSGN
jgi:RNA polymerase sigma factor for flagellar operon FliA